MSNPCSNIHFQCSQLESRRNKENRLKKSPKIGDLKHYLKAEVSRTYIPRKERRQGMTDL